MVCGSCGVTNETGRKFCAECGTRLSIACPACGAPNAPAAKFCGECGAAVPVAGAVASSVPAATAAATPGRAARHVPGGAIAERRLVSVLFADLVGFTPFAEARDAEEVRETLSRYFEIASETIARYGGVVEKFIGDAVMAVWGAPVAHEDDAERAVRAGLELVDAVRALGPTIMARAGVLTGEAAVTLGATNQGMVAGDLVNTAARLQAAAPPGTVLVGEATMGAASRAIVFEPAGEQVLKGKAAPVAAWRALRVVAERGGRNRSRGAGGARSSGATTSCGCSRTGSTAPVATVGCAPSRSPGRRASARAGSRGSSRSTSMGSWSRCSGTTADRPRSGARCRSGRSRRWSAGGSGWPRRTTRPTTRARITADLPQWVADADERRWVEAALLALLGVDGSDSGPAGP